ncbi:MAG: endonuclease NucS domain-containing protein [Phycisphaerae bacterium]|jgi:hypothetical protein
MKESDLESVLAKYPDLIETGLILTGRQVTVYGRRMDLLFDDKHKRKLIVELKAGPIKDEHIGQILSYEGMLLSADNPDIRVMLVGSRVPPNIQKTLDHHGIAWKEIKLTSLKEFLANKGDNQFDNLFEDEIYPSVKMTKNETNNNASIDNTKGGIMKGNTQQAPLPIMFNTILRNAGLSPADVRLIRHKDKRATKGHTPYELWCENRPRFEKYQSEQEIRARKKFTAPYWAVFIVDFNDDTMFAGLYAVRYQGLLPKDTLSSHVEGDVYKAGSCDVYDLTLQDRLSDFIGKLFIDWGLGYKAWVQYADRQDKPVVCLNKGIKADAD